MITLSSGYRPLFRDQINTFCSNNDIIITYKSNLGNGRYDDFYNFYGDVHNIDKLEKYVNQLEEKRKKQK